MGKVNVLRIIDSICRDLNSVGHTSNPRVLHRRSFKLDDFKAQPSDAYGVETEYVRSQITGPSDDDTHSTIAYPIGAYLFVIDCTT